MQKKTFEKIDNAAVVIGALVFAAFLIFDFSRENAHLSWIIFDAAMLALCLGCMVQWLPVSGVAKVLTLIATRFAVGLVLAVSFTVFAFRAENLAQLALAAFIVGMGLFMVVAEVRPIKISRVRGGAGEQR